MTIFVQLDYLDKILIYICMKIRIEFKAQLVACHKIKVPEPAGIHHTFTIRFYLTVFLIKCKNQASPFQTRICIVGERWGLSSQFQKFYAFANAMHYNALALSKLLIHGTPMVMLHIRMVHVKHKRKPQVETFRVLSKNQLNSKSPLSTKAVFVIVYSTCMYRHPMRKRTYAFLR